MARTIIGVDCATEAKKVGIALAVERPSGWTVEDVAACASNRTPVRAVCEWVRGADTQVLLALDAPLGWPLPLGRALREHRAGKALGVPAHALFRRETDEFVKRITGKQPLDVGADRIARTAHWALNFLGELRQELAEEIPLAWSPALPDRIAAIEVYPAATLKARRVSAGTYKRDAAGADRRAVLEAVGGVIALPGVDGGALTADAVDALVCVVAGVDFLSGRAIGPEREDVAQLEGWIWFTRPGSTGGEPARA